MSAHDIAVSLVALGFIMFYGARLSHSVFRIDLRPIMMVGGLMLIIGAVMLFFTGD